MMDTPISATQQRVTTLLSLTTDGTYDHARRLLEAAGLPGDGVPAGHTWRSVKKLSDAELTALLIPDAQLYAPNATSDLRPTREREVARGQQAAAEAKARRNAPRTWEREDEEDASDAAFAAAGQPVSGPRAIDEV